MMGGKGTQSIVLLGKSIGLVRFPVAVMEHHDQEKLGRKGFI